MALAPRCGCGLQAALTGFRQPAQGVDKIHWPLEVEHAVRSLLFGENRYQVG